MADAQGGAPAAQTGWRVFTGRERHAMLVAGLLGVGIILVALSNALGQDVVQSCGTNGSCTWSPDAARDAAQVWRWLGALAFTAGVAERVVMEIRALGRSAV
jgi:hypothetical protein